MKKKIVFISILIAAIVAGGYVWRGRKRSQRAAAFKTITVERGNLRVTVLATGATQPQNRLELKPPVAGRIEEILVREGESVRKGQVLAWLSSTERAALLDAARAKGEKELAYWEGVYKPTPLVSPMQGVVIARNMEPGQTVTTQDAPLVMSDRLIVKAQVDETDIGRLQLNLKAEIVLDAYPDRPIAGAVNHIAYEAKTVNNVTMYEVDVLPEHVPPFMRSGMTANVTFIVQKKDGVLFLPQEAVRQQGKESSVLLPAPPSAKKKKPESVPIRTGISDGKRVEVADGLKEGDSVLVPDLKLDHKGKRGSNPLSPFGGARPGGGGRAR